MHASMTQLSGWFVVAIALAGCTAGAGVDAGAIRIDGVPGQGELYLDGIARGPIAREQVLEGLAPGGHIVELRSGEQVLASVIVEVRARMIFGMRLERPPPPAAAPPPPPPPVTTEPPDAVLAAPPVAVVQVPVATRDPAAVEHAPAGPDLHAIIEDHYAGDVLVPSGIEKPIPLARRSPSGPRVRAGAVDIRGALARAQVRAVVRRGIDAVRRCYQLELLDHPDLAGRIVLEITVGETGRVQRAWVSSTDLPRSGVEACVADVAERWTFPAPRDARPAVVNQSLVLVP